MKKPKEEQEEPIKKKLLASLSTNKMIIANRSALLLKKKSNEKTPITKINAQNSQKSPMQLLPAIRLQSKSLHIKGNLS